MNTPPERRSISLVALDVQQDEFEKGRDFMKFPRTKSTKPRQTRVYINFDTKQILWESKKNKKKEASINFDEIREVREGQATNAFDSAHARVYEPCRSFSVVYGETFKTLDLVAPWSDVRDKWVATLRACQIGARRVMGDSPARSLSSGLLGGGILTSAFASIHAANASFSNPASSSSSPFTFPIAFVPLSNGNGISQIPYQVSSPPSSLSTASSPSIPGGVSEMSSIASNIATGSSGLPFCGNDAHNNIVLTSSSSNLALNKVMGLGISSYFDPFTSDDPCWSISTITPRPSEDLSAELVTRPNDPLIAAMSSLHHSIFSSGASARYTNVLAPAFSPEAWATCSRESADLFLRRVFNVFDFNNSRFLEQKEVAKVLHAFNVNPSKLQHNKEAKTILKSIQKQKLMHVDELSSKFHSLRHACRPRILYALFRSVQSVPLHATPGTLAMDPLTLLAKGLDAGPSSDEDELMAGITYAKKESLWAHQDEREETISVLQMHTFLTECQKLSISLDECAGIVSQYTTDPMGTAMTFDGFCEFLASGSNPLIQPQDYSVHMDMTQPLASYYVLSSHNTYLTGHQLKGTSSVEAYARALIDGCRCVELDCWDGPNNQPVVYHGRTLVTKVLFKDCLETIDRYAFVSSSYPVILSLEVHCCHDQQRVMASMIREVFGEKLVTSHGLSPASPSSLQYRILIKTKSILPSSTSPPQAGLSPDIVANTTLPEFYDFEDEFDEASREDPSGSSTNPMEESMKPKKKRTKDGNVNIAGSSVKASAQVQMDPTSRHSSFQATDIESRSNLEPSNCSPLTPLKSSANKSIESVLSERLVDSLLSENELSPFMRQSLAAMVQVKTDEDSGVVLGQMGDESRSAVANQHEQTRDVDSESTSTTEIVDDGESPEDDSGSLLAGHRRSMVLRKSPLSSSCGDLDSLGAEDYDSEDSARSRERRLTQEDRRKKRTRSPKKKSGLLRGVLSTGLVDSGSPPPNAPMAVPLGTVSTTPPQLAQSPIPGSLSGQGSPSMTSMNTLANNMPGLTLGSSSITAPSSTATPLTSAVRAARELAELAIHFRAMRFPGITKVRLAPNENEMAPEYEGVVFSIKEAKALSILRTARSQLEELNRYAVTRVYPDAIRVNSSNFEPVIFWSAGCQLVALNWQTHDKGQQINTGFFLRNGRCGYVLKPRHLLRGEMQGKPPPPLRLRIWALAAQQLPKPKERKNGEIIDTYIEIQVFDGPGPLSTAASASQLFPSSYALNQLAAPQSSAGMASNVTGTSNSANVSGLNQGVLSNVTTGVSTTHVSVASEPSVSTSPSSSSTTWRTATVIGNGFCPEYRWSGFGEWVVKEPEIAVARFAAFDANNASRDEMVGYFCVPVASIRQGYRYVPLRNAEGKIMDGCGVLVYAEVLSSWL